MALNGVLAVILRYSTELGSFMGSEGAQAYYVELVEVRLILSETIFCVLTF